MPEYKPHPTAKDTPSRMNRKRARTDVFLYNKYEAKKETKKRLAKEKEEKEKANAKVVEDFAENYESRLAT